MFEYAISLEYMPPQSFYASAMYYETAKVHVHVRSYNGTKDRETVRGHHGYKAVVSVRTAAPSTCGK